MSMGQIVTLLNGVTATGAGPVIRLDKRRTEQGSIPILISGITTATVVLQGTIATDQEVDEGTAKWENIADASWTADVADGLFTAFTHIRGNVTAWTAGTIYVKALI